MEQLRIRINPQWDLHQEEKTLYAEAEGEYEHFEDDLAIGFKYHVSSSSDISDLPCGRPVSDDDNTTLEVSDIWAQIDGEDINLTDEQKKLIINRIIVC